MCLVAFQQPPWEVVIRSQDFPVEYLPDTYFPGEPRAVMRSSPPQRPRQQSQGEGQQQAPSSPVMRSPSMTICTVHYPGDIVSSL